ncbi:MAG TPA: Asp-tRNA(Asn)/Glu-tRNA(Gln) amidotransferase subunit GatB [Oligoflexia bacterium]|nr:Asp-tRNA(Asn)/Glu-tRNA(Gln) amidotransferase subunit GatB [Oligoflexia bacterium]HMR25425.1 Asp-tRNA(Asn)/Glu-tRNA(Gln) amidotransferase subunit GatB [Oligoflexia bacterium]
MNTKYEAVIGLEVHAQLNTQTKLFCRCKNEYGQEANSATCPVCLGLPGALPKINQFAIVQAVKAGLALNCNIQLNSVFSRKNYFYPDLPKGYQISQFDKPLCLGGQVEIEVNEKKTIVILERIHMEEDAGKLLHGDSTENKGGSLVDLNRAGVPLIEIVTTPCMSSGEQASAYLKKLRNILRYINVCDGNMEEGSLRCDANVSIRPIGSKTLGTKVEVKNMNSFKHVQKAIEYEIERQSLALDNDEEIHQETRLWNPDQGISITMRSKEESNDYRYFPEPDLKALDIAQAWIDQIKENLEELPDTKKQRYITDYALPSYDAGVLTSDKDVAAFFEHALNTLGVSEKNAKNLSNFVMAEVLRLCKELSVGINDLKFDAQDLAQLLSFVEDGTINGKIAKDIIDSMAETGEKPQTIIESKGLKQLSDPNDIKPIIDQIIQNNPKQVEQYKSGKDKLFGFFVGQTMKETKGKANPGMVNQLLKDALK